MISESPDDLQPVFHAIVGGLPFRLFRCAMSALPMREGNGFRAMSVARIGSAGRRPQRPVVPLDAQANLRRRSFSGRCRTFPDWLAVELLSHELRCGLPRDARR